MIIFLTSLLIVASGLWTAPPVQGQTQDQTLLEDTFNYREITSWRQVRNEQLLDPTKNCRDRFFGASWRIKAGRIGIEIDGPACQTELVPINLDLSKTTGYSIQWNWFLKDSLFMDRNFVVIWNDVENWLGLKLFGNELFVEKVVDGVGQLVAGPIPVSLQKNTEPVFKAAVSQAELIVSVDNEETVKVPLTPGELNFQTIALRASVGLVKRSKSYFDNLVVTEISQPFLSVPFFKQHDPQWAEIEYDSASTWSEEPTIKRWGCVITSLAMIMRAHGLPEMPSGVAINPETLNTWLLEQPDGYVGNGLVNWWAVTRLTQQISNLHGTPILEYSRHNGEFIEEAKRAINSMQPVILEVPGHFLVGTAVASTGDDLLIQDPAYSYTLLSEHQQPLRSTRTLTPSFTDLSYIVINSPDEISVKLVDANDQELPFEYYTESISGYESSETTGEHYFWTFQKPESTHVTLQVTQPEFGEYSLQILSYTVDGEVSKQDYTGFTGTSPHLIELTYQKETASESQFEVEAATLSEDFTEFTTLQEITSKLVSSRLGRYFKLAAEAETKAQQDRYYQLLSRLLKLYEKFITPVTYQFLYTQIRLFLAQ